jgi:TonB family protein
MWSRLNFVALSAALIYAAGIVIAQSPPNPDTGKSNVALTEVFPPVYPPLARQTHIVGQVLLELRVRPDGSVASLKVVTGHPLLAQAALDSARQSHFSCTNCRESLFPYRLEYTFQFADTEDCCDTAHLGFPKVSHSADHVIVVERPLCTCDPVGTITKVRSIKCLYLWHCSVRYPL